MHRHTHTDASVTVEIICTHTYIHTYIHTHTRRITGGTVMDRIIAIDHFSEKDAAAVTADVLNAIHYLHNIGITHRDLKVSAPSNLYILLIN